MNNKTFKKIYIPVWLDKNSEDAQKLEFFIDIYIPVWLDKNPVTFAIMLLPS